MNIKLAQSPKSGNLETEKINESSGSRSSLLERKTFKKDFQKGKA